MGPGLAVVLAGLVALVWLKSTGRVILAVGMVIHLAGVVNTVTRIVLLNRELPPPRPNFLNLRLGEARRPGASADQGSGGHEPSR